MMAAMRTHAKLMALRPSIIVCWSISLIVMGGVAWNFERSPLDVASAVAIMATASLAIALLSIFVAAPMSARRQFRQSPALSRPQMVWWDDRGLHTRNENGEVMSPWSDLYAHYQSPDMFMVYHSAAFFGLVPQRVLTNEDRVEILRYLAKAGVPDRRKPKRRH